MIRRPPRSTLDRSSAASDVYKRQLVGDDRALTGDGLGVPDHPEQRPGLDDPVDDEVGVEDLVAAVLGVGLREHHQLDVAGVAPEPGERVDCLLYTSPSPRDRTRSRMPSSA